ncbi:CarboxypepD_reg-like domain-containing protein [Chitinophaga sp. YR627]|uniref:carboxypeptidase-like regulatory domain-containing protein n=1 Tax=Chitinophaga sp. YR627 TaxID=1881041 RepID=UPI0008F0DF7D|nr:carboxypeptidase-like regulatory domain-containing protein [Chitinophaga sp. YR627]SFN93740.1 CarboxypepD_reg-like domain-containing protein [Chitinophaga sp. YR627]
MRKKNPVTLSIPQSCHESWQDMTPDEKGKFCQHCQKSVIDFTNMSDHEIANLMNRSKGQLCGRLHVSQLNREIYTTEKHTPWMKIAAMISALTLTAPAMSAKAAAIATVQLNEKEDIIAKGDTTIVVSGHVVDTTADHKPLPGIEVVLKGGKIKNITDTTGAFTLHLPTDIKREDLLLIISSIGYQTQILPISSPELQQNIVVALVPQQFDIEGVVLGGVHSWRPSTVWQRLKYKIGSLFH